MFVRQRRQVVRGEEAGYLPLRARESSICYENWTIREQGRWRIKHSFLRSTDNTTDCIMILNIIKLFRSLSTATQTNIRMLFRVCHWNRLFSNAVMQKGKWSAGQYTWIGSFSNHGKLASESMYICCWNVSSRTQRVCRDASDVLRQGRLPKRHTILEWVNDFCMMVGHVRFAHPRTLEVRGMSVPLVWVTPAGFTNFKRNCFMNFT